jgi:predicted ATPase
MISSLTLSNFKCFRRQSVPLGAMNVLAGTNGSGKSSVIQALLTIRQSYDANSLARGRLLLNGRLVDLGTAQDVYCREPEGESIGIEVESSASGLAPLSFIAPFNGETRGLRYLQLTDPPELWLEQGLFADLFNYLHAERIGPRRAFDIRPDETHPLNVGKDGAGSAYVVAGDQRTSTITNEALLLSNDEGQELATIQYQWPLWMARLFPGFASEPELIERAEQVRMGIALHRQGTTGQPVFVRPPNTGFGLSFAQGIVVAGLAARAGTMLVVENPEAHLHPRAQSAIGDFLARVAAGGVQVIVETHSEHVLNGMRRTIKGGVLGSEQTKILFFSASQSGTGPVQRSIRISESGELSDWPEGFFDQLEKDLGEIL